MKRNQISWLLAVSVTLTLTLAAPAYADESTADESVASDENSVVEYDDESSEEETLTSSDGTYEYTLTEDGNASVSRYVGGEAVVSIPSELDGYTVTEMGGGALAQLTTLTDVTLPATLETINDSCFYGCSSLKNISVEDGNAAYAVKDGVLFSADGADLICYPAATEGTSYTIPDGVVEIWSSAFAATSLTSVTFPDTLLYIDDWTFSQTTLESLELPDSLLEIGQYAFAYCPRLTEVTFPNALETIDAAAFAGCENLTSVSFPDSLATIQMAAFAGTGLTEVTIPANVSAIGYCAFGYEEDLTTVVEDFIVYGTTGSQAQTYCTDEDSENDYSNSFTFRSVMSEEVEGEATSIQSDTEKSSLWQRIGKWVLLGVGVLALLVIGLILVLSGRGKKKSPAVEAQVDETDADTEAEIKTEEEIK